jgi:hypothetical protein
LGFENCLMVSEKTVKGFLSEFSKTEPFRGTRKPVRLFQNLSLEPKTFPDTFMSFRKGFRSDFGFRGNAFYLECITFFEDTDDAVVCNYI